MLLVLCIEKICKPRELKYDVIEKKSLNMRAVLSYAVQYAILNQQSRSQWRYLNLQFIQFVSYHVIVGVISAWHRKHFLILINQLDYDTELPPTSQSVQNTWAFVLLEALGVLHIAGVAVYFTDWRFQKIDVAPIVSPKLSSVVREGSVWGVTHCRTFFRANCSSTQCSIRNEPSVVCDDCVWRRTQKHSSSGVQGSVFEKPSALNEQRGVVSCIDPAPFSSRVVHEFARWNCSYLISYQLHSALSQGRTILDERHIEQHNSGSCDLDELESQHLRLSE